MGSPVEPNASPILPTASFYTNTRKSTTPTKSKPRYPFCAGSHILSLCDSFKDPKQRFEIVRKTKLCFNCLGHHKVSSCNSRHCCHSCQRKHHTSLYTGGQHNAIPSEQPPQPTSPRQQTNTSPGQPTTAANTNSTDTTSLSMILP